MSDQHSDVYHGNIGLRTHVGHTSGVLIPPRRPYDMGTSKWLSAAPLGLYRRCDALSPPPPVALAPSDFTRLRGLFRGELRISCSTYSHAQNTQEEG